MINKPMIVFLITKYPNFSDSGTAMINGENYSSEFSLAELQHTSLDYVSIYQTRLLNFVHRSRGPMPVEESGFNIWE